MLIPWGREYVLKWFDWLIFHSCNWSVKAGIWVENVSVNEYSNPTEYVTATTKRQCLSPVFAYMNIHVHSHWYVWLPSNSERLLLGEPEFCRERQNVTTYFHIRISGRWGHSTLSDFVTADLFPYFLFPETLTKQKCRWPGNRQYNSYSSSKGEVHIPWKVDSKWKLRGSKENQLQQEREFSLKSKSYAMIFEERRGEFLCKCMF